MPPEAHLSFLHLGSGCGRLIVVLGDISMVLVAVSFPFALALSTQETTNLVEATIPGGSCSGSNPYSINSEHLQRHAIRLLLL